MNSDAQGGNLTPSTHMEGTGSGDVGKDQLSCGSLAIAAVGGDLLQQGIAGLILRDHGNAGGERGSHDIAVSNRVMSHDSDVMIM